jgi:predicted 2-oxoglutarate/Fe(II)-dependent dioxygenase YbiX
MSDQQQRPDPALPGDVLPNLVLPDATGAGVGMAQQSYAGRWQVLLFLEPGALAAQADQIAAARKRMDAIEGRLHVVLFTEPSTSVADADLFDQSRGGSEFLLGEPGPGAAVISPTGQLAGRFSGDGLEDAVTLCEAAYGADTRETLTMAAPVLIIPEVLEPELCKRIMDFWQSSEKLTDQVASEQQGNQAAYSSIKRRTDAVIGDGQLFSDIRRGITRRILPMIDRAFRMQVASMEALRVGQYSADNEGAFGRHRDNTTKHTAHRRLAMTLNLNTGDYEGGELSFPEFGHKLYAPAAGSAAIFSCSLLHEALPVTKGERFAMFTFFTDTAGLEQEKKAARQREQQQAAPAPAPQS